MAADEDFLARLTEAAYRTALGRGIRGSFIDLELELWAALREVVEAPSTPRVRRREVERCRG